MTLRAATVADVPVILELIRGLAEYERLSDQVVATAEDLRATLFGPRPCAEVVLAEEQGDAGTPVVAGFALFFHNYSTFRGRPGVYLEDLFVRPEWRGRGIGRALLERVREVARSRGCGRVEWAVLAWNEPAIGFYRRLGADLMDDWRLCRISLG